MSPSTPTPTPSRPDGSSEPDGGTGDADTVYVVIEGPAPTVEGEMTDAFTIKLLDKDGNPITTTQDMDVKVVFSNVTSEDGDFDSSDQIVTIEAGNSETTFVVQTNVDIDFNNEIFNAKIDDVDDGGQFENIDIDGFTDTNGTTYTGDVNAVITEKDTDGDGIADPDDIDDDNDGILDVDEANCDMYVEANFVDYDGQATSYVNDGNLKIGDAVIHVESVIYGEGEIDENEISDHHYDGEYGVLIGNNSGTTETFDDRIETTFTFSDSIKNIKFKINDIDYGDHVTVNIYDESEDIISLDSSMYSLYSPTVVNVDGNTFYAGDKDGSSSDTRKGTVEFDLEGYFVTKVVFQYWDPESGGTVTYTGFSGTVCDPDGDGIANYVDIDSDGDGIVDNIEAQTTTEYIAPTGIDTDGDGLDDAYDPDNGGVPVSLPDTDGDGTPDYLDTDSDNDGLDDALEGWDLDGDGVANVTASGTDLDEDGLDDGYDNDTTSLNPTNGTAPDDYPDINNPGGDKDWREEAVNKPEAIDSEINFNEAKDTDMPSSYIFELSDFGYHDDDGDPIDSIRISSLEDLTLGTLYLDGAVVSEGDIINAVDIDTGKLTYIPADADDSGSDEYLGDTRPDGTTVAEDDLGDQGEDYARFEFDVNDGTYWSTTSATMSIDVNAVADTPTISIDASTTLSEDFRARIDYTNINDPGNGYSITPYNADGSEGVFQTHASYPTGFGVANVSGDTISGWPSELGYDKTVDAPEMVKLELDYPVDHVDLIIGWLNSDKGEKMVVEFYRDGTLINTYINEDGTDGLDALRLEAENGQMFDEIRFYPAEEDSDFLIHSIEFDRTEESTTTGEIVVNENGAAALDLSAGLSDTDGSESLKIELRDVPDGFGITDGTHTYTNTTGANTTVDISDWDLDNLTLQVPEVAVGTIYTITAAAVATEYSNGSTAEATTDLNVTVINETLVTLDEDSSGSNGNVFDDTSSNPTVESFQIDSDGDGVVETYNAGDTVTISGVGELTLEGDGSYSFTPVADWSGLVPLVTYEAEGVSQNLLNIQVTPVSDTPTLNLSYNSYHLELVTEGYTLSNGSWGYVDVLEVDGDSGDNYPEWYTNRSDDTVEIGQESLYIVGGDGNNYILELESGDAGGNPNGNMLGTTIMSAKQGEMYHLEFDYNRRDKNTYDDSPENSEVDIIVINNTTGEETKIDTLYDDDNVIFKHYSYDLYIDESDSDLAADGFSIEFRISSRNDDDTYGAIFDNIELDLLPVTGIAGEKIRLPSIAAATTDSDGSETISRIEITGLDEGITISDGNGHSFTATATNNTANITTWNKNELYYYTDTTDSSDRIDTITVVVTSTEKENGASSVTTEDIDVTILADTSSATLIDGIIEGMYYETSSGLTGYTDEEGGFNYLDDDTVIFRIGDLVVGSIDMSQIEDSKVFLQDLAGVERSNLNDKYVENLAVLLQSLDVDGDASNGIVITEEIREAFDGMTMDLESIGEEPLREILEQITGHEAIDESTAMDHVAEMLVAYEGVSAEVLAGFYSEIEESIPAVDEGFKTLVDNVEERSIDTPNLEEILELGIDEILPSVSSSEDRSVEGGINTEATDGVWEFGVPDDPTVVVKIEDDVHVTI